LQEEDLDALEEKLTALCRLCESEDPDDFVRGQLAAKTIKVDLMLRVVTHNHFMQTASSCLGRIQA